MAEIKVTSNMLRTKAAEFRSYIQTFEAERQNLNMAEQKLMTTFEGDAATAFNTNFQTFNSQMMNFKTVIDAYVNDLETAAQSYENMEMQSAQIASQK